MVEKCHFVNSMVKIIQTTGEHVSVFLTQFSEVSTMEHTRICNYSLSLTGPAFSWFSSLQPCSIGSWAHSEKKFANIFTTETMSLNCLIGR